MADRFHRFRGSDFSSSRIRRASMISGEDFVTRVVVWLNRKVNVVCSTNSGS